jgi:4'-phosphopantetheinyl transferase
MFWQSPDKFPILRQNEVHLWLASLARSQQEIATFWETLNAEERQRAKRFVMPQHRERFIVARGMLRQLLANYLNYPAPQIKFSQGTYGKISLHQLLMPTAKIKFNLSHANNYALFAFAIDRDLGVDIEYMRADIEMEDIAQRFFSPAEASALLSLPKEARSQAFFNCWTRKEAFIKALGKGLYYPLHEFDVDIKVNGETKVDLSIHDQALQDKNWSLFSLNTISNYAAALVVEGSVEQEKLIKYKLDSWR